MSKRVHIVVRGRVQNVGFRQFVVHRATALALSGWVRNLPDERTVELEAEGDEAAVDALTSSVRRGPLGARVESVQVEVIASTEKLDGFRVAQ